MTEDEVVMLARYVRALCPQQKFDEYTSDAWHDVLSDCPLDDARAAAAAIARKQPFVAPSEILAEVRAIRAQRLEGFQYEPQPGDDDPRRYLANARAQLRAVGDGRRPAALQLPELPGPDIADVAPAFFQTIPGDDKPRPDRSPLTVPCPKCAARIGHHCRWPHGGRRPTHTARKRAAQGEPIVSPNGGPDETARRAAAATALARLTPDERAALTTFQQNEDSR